MHWDADIPSPLPFGFVYEIQGPSRYYIGKKQCWKRIKRPPLKGKKRKRICSVESDWATYTGSCRELNEDIEKLGKDVFSFQILRWCESKWELSYYELREQMAREVLADPLSYNGIINVRLRSRPSKAEGELV